MPWGAVAGAVVGAVANKAMATDKNGGAGTQTQSKEPWSGALPWINSNMQSGQALQSQLTQQPFSPQQQAAYANLFNQDDYTRQLVPSLLGQMSQQQVGFDRTGAQPNTQKAWDWTGLMGAGSPNLSAQSVASAIKPTADTSSSTGTGNFTQYDPASNPMAGYYAAYMSPEMSNMLTDGGKGVKQAFQSALGNAGGAGYGSFQYGQAAPSKGTQAYRDMQEYFQYGGNDPYNLYGKAGT